MALTQPCILKNHTQNAFWTGTEWNANPDEAKEYTSINNAILDIDNIEAGWHYEAIQTIKKPYPTSLAKTQ